MTADLVSAVLAFGRRLRSAGLPADPGRLSSAAAALTQVDVLDPRDFYHTLRAFLVNSPDQIVAFNRVYRSFWRWPGASGTRLGTPHAGPEASLPMVDDGHPPDEQAAHALIERGTAGAEAPPAAPGSATALRGDAAGERDTAVEAPVPGLLNPAARWSDGATDAAVAQIVSKIVEQLSLRPGRRYRAAPHGARLDLRRTLRQAVRFGGRPLRLPRRSRKPQRPRIVLFCDVSHSMEAHSVFILRVVHSLHNQRARIESFVFSTRLLRVTPYLRRWILPHAVRRIAGDFPEWSGGTRIGECMDVFRRRYARQVLNRRTVFVLMTDGITVADAGLVHRVLRRLAERAGAVIWLNPMIGEPDYDPAATSVGGALDCIDVVAPMRDLATLRRLAERLGGRPRQGAAGRTITLQTVIGGTGRRRAGIRRRVGL